MGLFDIFRKKPETKSAPSTGSRLIKSTAKFDDHLSLAIASLMLYEQRVSQNAPINYQALGFKSASDVIALLNDLTKSIMPASKSCYDQAVIKEKTRVLSIAPDDLYNAYDVAAAPLFYLNVCAKDAKELSPSSTAASAIDSACQQFRQIVQSLDDMTSMNGMGSIDRYIDMRNQGYAWAAAAVAQAKRGDAAARQLTFDDYMHRALSEVEQAMRQRGDLA